MADNVDAAKQKVNERVAKVVNPNLSEEEMIKEYDAWAKTYESDGAIWGYKSPIVAAREVGAILGSNKDARILDTCAGTGKTGEFIFNAGYTNIDASDASNAMLEEAKKKNVFKNVFQAYLGKPLDVADDSYDVITLFGGLIDGHVKPDCFSCFRDFVRVLKPGGHFVAGTEKGTVGAEYKKKVEASFQELVDEGLWDLVANKISNEGTYEEQMWIYKVK